MNNSLIFNSLIVFIMLYTRNGLLFGFCCKIFNPFGENKAVEKSNTKTSTASTCFQ